MKKEEKRITLHYKSLSENWKNTALALVNDVLLVKKYQHRLSFDWWHQSCPVLEKKTALTHFSHVCVLHQEQCYYSQLKNRRGEEKHLN